MRILGIESTAHTASVGIVDEGTQVLASATDMYRPGKGGIHPREAANHHAEVLPDLVERALSDSKVDPGTLDAVAFSQGPGLGPCLRAGATVARMLSLSWERPLVPVNHCVAHLEIARALSGFSDPVLLYASGGNTQIVAYAHGRYRVLGETLDIGVGNFLDKLALGMGSTFPGGPWIERWAKEGKKVHELPYSVHGMDVSFSGLLTAARALQTKGVPKEEVALSVESHAYAMLCEVAERALAHLGARELVLGGGVACNERLRRMVEQMAHARGVRVYAPPPALCVDNGGMIAWTGLLARERGISVPVEGSEVLPRQRTDQVEATWRLRLREHISEA
ncbi:MAG: bifunctional N(6)-L-threonylcarbamoyladenine synthase/serine/threonine protein kinase [Euryarchaeota archaeon]|nr:bifunctional N(6)-L-threonylcarbamoyladenine synthase/serine/threonine protein kinase [Euryarchaeota archaeon]MDE1835132.1 bifunctional N(6)-L-threonylcarbamoyladenine synthase/serine/threonine protein kinase [Euryarchaeota archaeon]MDE1881889.1 bifunctional N(6)-L-threonylcarbamoyladenine synthase/serine/threonine protein kinase [Euryarchaeota archaeon]MDE2044905.1 bifunctional N(6)-L-threonylcarbamoyladenine synthase/serine/threonine protein kinase [Thermoplasmata archaeon]